MRNKRKLHTILFTFLPWLKVQKNCTWGFRLMGMAEDHKESQVRRPESFTIHNWHNSFCPTCSFFKCLTITFILQILHFLIWLIDPFKSQRNTARQTTFFNEVPVLSKTGMFKKLFRDPWKSNGGKIRMKSSLVL